MLDAGWNYTLTNSYEVFGHFQLAFEVDGAEEKRSYGIDPDEIIYSMLEN